MYSQKNLLLFFGIILLITGCYFYYYSVANYTYQNAKIISVDAHEIDCITCTIYNSDGTCGVFMNEKCGDDLIVKVSYVTKENNTKLCNIETSEDFIEIGKNITICVLRNECYDIAITGRSLFLSSIFLFLSFVILLIVLVLYNYPYNNGYITLP